MPMNRMHETAAAHACVFGLGWGDEGKGKIVDLLCPSFDVVVRFNGGANAGHTVWIGGDKFALHLLPAGVLHEGMTAVIGPGVVVDPISLLAELDGLAARGVDAASRLRISSRAHLVLPYHKLEDQLSEQAAGGGKIGTTARGIGPCYADKMRRSSAIRFADLIGEPGLADRVRKIVASKSAMFHVLYGGDGAVSADDVIADLDMARTRLAGLVVDTTALLGRAMADGKKVLFEGANGLLLDVDHGTYPFVTSSSTGPHGLAAGGGVPATSVTRFIGAIKAYATRVGSGPFVSELTDEVGDRIRIQGNEFGTTTGRPRRCGWFDAVSGRYGVALSGCTEIALMHLDTLSGFEQVGICTAYEVDGRRCADMPADARVLEGARPVIEFVPGWSGDLRSAKSFDDLPPTAQAYVHRIEKLTGAPVGILSVGPERTQTIFRNVEMRKHGNAEM
jgi:adenylosuccinate synthase